MSDFDELWDKKFGKAGVVAKATPASQGKSFDDLWNERFGSTPYTEPPKTERPFQPAPTETIAVAPGVTQLGTKPAMPESAWAQPPPVTMAVPPISVSPRPVQPQPSPGRIGAEWQIPPGPAGEGMALRKTLEDATKALSLGVNGPTVGENIGKLKGAWKSGGIKGATKTLSEQIRAIPEETGQWVGEVANLMDKYGNTPGPTKTPWDRMPEQVKNLPGSMARLAAGIVQFPVDVLAKVGGLSIEQAGDLADKAQKGDVDGLGKSMRNYSLWDSPLHQTLFDLGEQIETPIWQTSAYMAEKAGIPNPIYSLGKLAGIQPPSEAELQAVEEMAVKRPAETAAGQFMGVAPALGVLGKSKLGKLTPKEAMRGIATEIGKKAEMHLDELTGLPNQKTHFMELRKTEGAVGILDADNFKGLKERFKENAEGAGDEILRQVGTRLNEIAGRYGVKVSRRGGEEFGVWKEGMTAEELAPTLEAIRKELSTMPYTVYGEDVPITFSGGVGDINTKNLKMPDEAANIAMKQAKASGKNQSIVAERRLGTRLPEKGGMAFKVGDETITGANEGNLASNALDRGLWEKARGLPPDQIQAGYMDKEGNFVADENVKHQFNNAMQALLWEREKGQTRAGGFPKPSTEPVGPPPPIEPPAPPEAVEPPGKAGGLPETSAEGVGKPFEPTLPPGWKVVRSEKPGWRAYTDPQNKTIYLPKGHSLAHETYHAIASEVFDPGLGTMQGIGFNLEGSDFIKNAIKYFEKKTDLGESQLAYATEALPTESMGNLIEGYLKKDPDFIKQFPKLNDYLNSYFKKPPSPVAPPVAGKEPTVFLPDRVSRRGGFIEKPAVYLRFGTPPEGGIASQKWSGVTAFGSEKGVSTYKAWYDPITKKYVLETPNADIVGTQESFIGRGDRKLYQISGDEIIEVGGDMETLLNPKTTRTIREISPDDVVFENEPWLTLSGKELNQTTAPNWDGYGKPVAPPVEAPKAPVAGKEQARLAEAQLLSEMGGAPVGAGLTTQPGIPPMLEPSIPITPRGPKLTWRQEANNLYTDLINRFDPVERAVKGAIGRGVEFAKGMNPTERMREYLGIGGKVKTTLRDGVFRIDEKTGNRVLVSEGYEPIIKDFQKETGKNNRQAEAEANDYLIANRYIQDLQRKSGKVAKYESELFDDIVKTQEKIDDLQSRGANRKSGKLSGGEKQQLAKLEDKLHGLHDVAQVEGLYDKAQSLKNIASEKQVADAIKTVADLKVKYKGDLSAFEKMSSRVYEFQKNVLHQLVDSGRMDEGVFQKIVSENPHYIPFDRVFEAEGIEALPTEGTPRAKGIFTRISQPVKEIKGSERGIHNTLETVIRNTYKILDESERNTVKRSIAKLADVIPDEVSIVSEKQRIPGNHFVDFYEGGQKQTMKVSSEIFKAMEGLDNVSSNMLVRFMAKPATWLRRGATTTLEFIGRNPMRDQWSAFTQTNVGYVPFVDLYKGVSHILKNDEIYKAWQASGGSQSGFVELSRPNLTKIYQSLMHNKPLLQKLNVITSLEDLSMLMEQGTRVGVFEKARVKGLSDVQAGFVSREASTDFARIGAQMKSANQMISFLNANIQGSNRAFRGWKQNPKAYTVKAVASITIPSVLLYLKNRNDPLYRELPQWDRDVFWHFRVGDTFYRIPKPFLEGAVFGSSVERFLGFAEGKDPHAMDGLFNLIVSAASPFNEVDPTSGIIPTALKPIIENATPRGWSFFRKQPLIPQNRENVEPYLQYGPYTSETAKLLGKATNKSPAKIENLVRGYTGGLGAYALGLGDLAIQTATGFNKPHRPYELSDIPGIKGFVSRNPLVAPQSLNDFYDNLDLASKADKSQKAIANEQGDVAGETYRINHPEIDIYPDLVSIQNEIKNVTDQIDEIVQRGDVSEKDKRSLLNELYWMRLNLAKQGNEIFRSTEQKSSLISTTPR